MAGILERWEAFAATCLPAATSMTALQLRDHGQQILEAIAADLGEVQSAEQQAAKSQGLAPARLPVRETAAQTHGVLRQKSGYDINQLASEYRALRASVIALWMPACLPEPPHLDDMIRFNEAIDQAVAESISHFSAQVEWSRSLLLGVIGHDMRGPLQTLQLAALALRRLDAGEQVATTAQRMVCGAEQLRALIDDLVDYSRMNLGLGLGIVPSRTDLAAICAQELEHLRIVHPEARVQFDATGDCEGPWDPQRLRQVVWNLVTNALRYGKRGAAVHVTLVGEPDEMRLEVGNAGPALDPETLRQIFEPLKRGRTAEHGTGLGLGLYVVSEIVNGHGGSVTARSDAHETVFTVRLPRSGPPV